MKKIAIFTVLGILAILLNGCWFSISKRIVQELDISNASGGSVEITNEVSSHVVTLGDGQSKIVDFSDTDFIKILFVNSGTVFRYNLTDIDIKVTPEKARSGTRVSGNIHWVYLCSINKNKTLVFKRKDVEHQGVEVVVTPL